MAIYFLGGSKIDDKNLGGFRDSGIDIYTDTNCKLKNIEKDICACILDLSPYKDKNVALRHGGVVGLSSHLSLLTLSFINPSNSELKEELNNMDVILVNMETVLIFLDFLKDTILLFQPMIDEASTVEERNDLRGSMRQIIIEHLKFVECTMGGGPSVTARGGV